MEALHAEAQQTNSDAVFLEVRESNAAARRLYENLGFHENGRRKAYYAEPSEDAVLYSKTLR
jgi:ribosomal-protein-alanine N-acetyltransferase